MLGMRRVSVRRDGVGALLIGLLGVAVAFAVLMLAPGLTG